MGEPNLKDKDEYLSDRRKLEEPKHAWIGVGHYEKEIFPLLDKGKNKFNWIAAFFGIFWFPYKGLWAQWLFWYMSYLTICTVVHYLDIPYVRLALTAFYIITVGFTANKSYYYLFRKLTTNDQPMLEDNRFAGLFGALLFSILFLFTQTSLLGLMVKIPVKDIDYVQSSKIQLYKKSTIGEAFKRYQYFSEVDWKNFTSADGKRIVQVTGITDFTKHPLANEWLKRKIIGFNVIFQFMVNSDGDSVDIHTYGIEMKLNDGQEVVQWADELGLTKGDLNTNILQIYHNIPFK